MSDNNNEDETINSQYDHDKFRENFNKEVEIEIMNAKAIEIANRVEARSRKRGVTEVMKRETEKRKVTEGERILKECSLVKEYKEDNPEDKSYFGEKLISWLLKKISNDMHSIINDPKTRKRVLIIAVVIVSIFSIKALFTEDPGPVIVKEQKKILLILSGKKDVGVEAIGALVKKLKDNASEEEISDWISENGEQLLKVKGFETFFPEEMKEVQARLKK